jgi:hypothetical protein
VESPRGEETKKTMKLNIKTEPLELELSTNLSAAIDDTVEAAFSLHISESDLIDILKERLHKKSNVIAASQFFSPNKMFHPEAGP